jgi:hypothetical protein
LNGWQMSQTGHFRPINDNCAMSAFHPIATKRQVTRRAMNVALFAITSSAAVK